MARDVDLVREELRELTVPVVEAAGAPGEPFGVYFFGAQEPESELARHVERVVFREFFDNSPELLDGEYGPFEADTIFVCVIDQRRRLPAGMGRVILPSAPRFKTPHDVATVWGEDFDALVERSGRDWDLGRVWDFATIAVAPEYRGKATDGLILYSILQTSSQGLLMTGGRFMLCLLDVKVREHFNALFYGAFEAFPGVEPRSYLDSPATVPSFVDFDWYDPFLASKDPDAHHMLLHELGTPGVVTGPAWAPLLRRAGVAPGPRSVTR